MTFTIDQVYKAGVPRGQFYRGPVTQLASGTTNPLVVSPSTSPAWAVLIESLKFLEESLTTSGTGTGIFQIEYPDYAGTVTSTFTVNSVTDLKHHADEVITVNSSTYYMFNFKPPLLVKGSRGVNSATFGLPDDVDVASGSLKFMPSGWTIKESDYD